MSSTQSETTLEELVAKLARLEEEYVRMAEELAALRAERPMALAQGSDPEQKALLKKTGGAGKQTTGKRGSRRGILRGGLGAAATVVGAGALLQMNAGVAHADKAGVFSSSVAGTPAVSATGTNGADGVDASSDSGTGVSASSINGSGVSGFSKNGTGISGLTTSGTGVSGSSPGGTGVFGFTKFGIGVVASGGFGTALQVQGHIQVQGDAVGQVTLPKGSTSVSVSSSAATPTSNVLLTPLSNPEVMLWVTRAAGSFTINAFPAPRDEVNIAFLIIN
jgi:hypothetical protein